VFDDEDFDYEGVSVILVEGKVFDNEVEYTGECTKDGEKHGKGVQTWKDGSRYEGYWKFGKAQGKGRLVHMDGDVYEGQWLDSKAHGFGIYNHTNGTRYIGNWKNDLQHGYGEETWG
jgi:hypothetical protein